ncbi:YycH family regulatory protein [Paenibacillus senegalimassiliensis]|uniref:YycH family regulatory protein n=1 Tax=Paenibacillus senegalimassiliensis TaxID=1737426 RepID=UPI00073FA53B|nr:two-component system activity regulator YycH [Paenibacillus senegalimassiliensis]
MKEKIKSLALALLVVCSLVQSYFLIYQLPGSNPVVKTESDYIRTENMGASLEAETMLFPAQIAVHMGEGKHTLFYPDSTFYNLIYSRLKGRQFDGFQRYAVDNVNWTEIRSEHIGVELEFGGGVPIGLLQRVMQIASDPLFDAESINRLLIYNTGTEDQVRVFFFSSRGDVVYEATKADLTMQDVQQQVDFGKDWVPYTLEEGYYLPEQAVDMVQVGLGIGLYSTEQMQRSLFFDPSITRYIREKDGSEIYTDGKRSLQVRQDRNWINYTDPAAPSAGENSPSKNVLSAVDFVNQHGGWNGKYRLEQMNDGAGGNQQRVVFQQYYGTGPSGAFPILDLAAFHYGVISLEVRQGTITGYERSLIYDAGDGWEKQVVSLPGGEPLREQLTKLKEEARIARLYPAYVPSLTEQGLLLKPMWVVELGNGATRVLPQSSVES